jgi:hypothetical protein
MITTSTPIAANIGLVRYCGIDCDVGDTFNMPTITRGEG